LALKPIHNEAALLLAVEKGNNKAFEEIFMAYHNQLASYVMLLTESRELTEEIIQDVFVKIWNGREKLAEIESFTSYLFILTRNYTLNALRKKVAEREKKSIYDKSVEHEQMANLNYQEEPNFHDLIDQAAIQLPPQQKKVFAMRMQGLKNQQIASEMQISPASVKKYQQWALKSVINYVRIFTGTLLVLVLIKNDLEIANQVFFDLDIFLS
jgi:RNA polymerase sigma-70 factor (family 1)